MATPTLGAALTHALEAGRNLGPRGMPVTLERVTQVFEDGRVEVKGMRIPVTGSGGPRGVRAGQMIAVSWQRGQPVVAIRHSARRTGAVGPQPQLGGVVEELFIAVDPTSGLVEVWFRNDQQVTNLALRVLMNADPSYVKWGTRSDAFVVGTAAHHYYICTLARTEDTVLGSAGAAASIVNHENPLDQNIVLVQTSNAFTLAGETKYWTITWDGVNGSAGTMGEAAPNAITASETITGEIQLTRISVEASSPRVLITDIQLNDALHLILVLQAMVNLMPIVGTAGTPATFSHPIQLSDNSGTFNETTNDDELNTTVGTYGTHVFVVNVSTATVVFKTCRDQIVQNVQTAVTRLHSYRQIPSGPNADLPTLFEQIGKNGQLLTVWGASALTPDFDYTDLVSDFAITTRPGVASYTYDEFDSTRTPYLDLTNIFDQESSTLTVGPNATRATDGFNLSQFHTVRATYTGRRIWQRKRYFLSATYLPRRATTPTVIPLGLLLVKAKLETRATATTLVPDSSFGFFLHDLQSGMSTTLVPMTDNFHSSQGVHIPGGSFFYSSSPETEGVFVVLGFNGTHLLWLHDHQDTPSGSDVVDIKLTNVSTLATVTAISGTGTPDLSSELLSFIERNFQTLRPDLFYYPSDTDDAGNNFVEAWDAQGVPTLNASAAGFPEINTELERFASLLDLPATIEPAEDFTIANNEGPVNIEDLTQTGPSWHVVQDTRLLSGSLTTDP